MMMGEEMVGGGTGGGTYNDVFLIIICFKCLYFCQRVDGGGVKVDD